MRIAAMMFLVLCALGMPGGLLADESSASFTKIYLKDGKIIECQEGWVDGGTVYYKKYGGVVGVPTDRVDMEKTLKGSEDAKACATATAREEPKKNYEDLDVKNIIRRDVAQAKQALEATESPTVAAKEPLPEAAPAAKEHLEQPYVQPPSPKAEAPKADPGKGIVMQKAGFSIALPDGWKEMPRDILDAYENEVSKQVGKANTPHFEYGFQTETSQKWFQHPYILVQIVSTGRIPESELEKAALSEAEVEGLKKNTSSIVSSFQVGAMRYSKHEKIIWMPLEANVLGVGLISGLSGGVPTEKGMIQVIGYSRKEDIGLYEPIFRSVVKSVSPEPGLAYKPKLTDSLPPAVSGIDWGQAAVNGIAAGLFFAIVALLAGLLKKWRGRSRKAGKDEHTDAFP